MYLLDATYVFNTHLLLDEFELSLQHLAHGPVCLEPRNVQQEVPDGVSALLSVHHLGVVLQTKDAPLRVLDGNHSTLQQQQGSIQTYKVKG